MFLQKCFCFVLLAISGIIAERIPLGSYEEILEALGTGNIVQIWLQTDLCDVEGTSIQPQMMNIPMDVWGEVEGTFGVKFLKFSYNNFDSDAFGNGLEGLVTMYEGTMRTNEVLIEVLTARPKDKWNLVGETRISCSLETGSAKAFSHNFGPRIRLSNYQDVVDHLTDSKTVTLTHSLANCENFDSVSYGNLKTGHTVDTFYVYQQGDQEMLKVVSTTAIFRNTQGFGSPYAVFTTNTNVFADGTVQVKPSFWDTIEWDNELGDGTGGSEVMEFICQLDPESTVFWASPDIVQPTFVGYSEVATALESGHELELVLDATECGNDVGQPNPATGLGTSIGGWEKTANGTIGFTAFHITEQGMIHYETYLLNPDNTLNLHINQFIYIGGINVMEVDVICEDISKAGFFYSRHPDLREDKNTMELLQEEVVSTGRPSVVINYFNCQDSAFGSEVTLAGFPAKFNYLSGDAENRVFGTHGSTVTKNFISGEGYAYVAVDLDVFENTSGSSNTILTHMLIDGDNFNDMWTRPQSFCDTSAGQNGKSVYIYG